MKPVKVEPLVSAHYLSSKNRFIKFLNRSPQIGSFDSFFHYGFRKSA